MVTELQTGKIYEVTYQRDAGPDVMLSVMKSFGTVHDHDEAARTFIINVTSEPGESEKSFLDGMQHSGVMGITEKV